MDNTIGVEPDRGQQQSALADLATERHRLFNDRYDTRLIAGAGWRDGWDLQAEDAAISQPVACSVWQAQLEPRYAGIAGCRVRQGYLAGSAGE